MSQIDYIFGFADAATAKADAQASPYWDSISAAWRADLVMPVTIWRTSQDTIDGSGNTVHHPLAGFFVWVSSAQPISALLNHASLKVAVDRDKLNARQAGAVLRSTVGAVVLQDIMIDPVFAGCNFPWGSLN